MTEWTATARRTERSPISCRSRSDTSDLSPHFAYSVTVTTDPRPAVSHWEHFDLVTVLWLLYLLLFNGVSCFLLFILSHLLSLSVPACLPLARSLSLCISLRCAISPPATSLVLSCCQEKLKLKQGFEEAAKLVRHSFERQKHTNNAFSI